MKLREKTNIEICDENNLPFTILSNVVEEVSTKDKMRATSNLIAKTLTATLGPYGTSTIIQDREGRHFATKDGYDLMNRLSFDDEVSRTILDLFRTSASSQVFSVGDGSTSTIVVANALFQALTDPANKELFKRIAPKDIVDMLNDISDFVENELKASARPLSRNMSELDIIAAVANNNDTEVGKLIGDIYREIGEYGFISMDVLDKKDKDEYEVKSGIEWERGYIEPLFARGYKDEKIVYDQRPRIILSNSTLTYDDLETVLMPLMKCALNQENAQLLIVANDFDEDVRTFLKANRTKHLKVGAKDIPMEFTPVDIDQVTKESRNKLEDLALLCGCKIYDKFATRKADVLVHPEDFVGFAGKVTVTPKKTEVIFTKDFAEDHRKIIDKKVKEFSNELGKLMRIEVPSKEEDLRIYELRQRISRLKNSSAIFHVAGKTLSERMTRQRLIEDAIFACKAAIKSGYIPGGNLSIPKILRAKKIEIVRLLESKYVYLVANDNTDFFKKFITILEDAFLESYRAVLNNSYMTEEETENTIEKCLSLGLFYNLKTHGFESWDRTAIINPVSTDIEILRSCMSLIGILSTSNQFLTINLNVKDQIRK